MQACPKCGHGIEGRPNFCPACGASLTYGAHEADPLIGRLLGGVYLIESLIGEGAMGRVYQATQTQLRRTIAVKILRSNLVNDSTVVKRFEREALAASRLHHPSCISVYGYGQEDDGDLLWMAMEFVQGRDLGTIIAEDSPMPIQRVVRILSQVCDALDEAHNANIIHRDLKPANVVVFDHRNSKDVVKVLDFGIAKITDPGDDYQPLTRDGIVCGTPAYMSPEQVQGFELDNRSDLFSLGIILYQTVTGRLPFYAESAVEVATKIVIEEPLPPSKMRTDWSYPAEVEAVVLKLLSKNKHDRYANALEVKAALERCLVTLRSRRDASLDLAPDEMAELMADADLEMEGAATLQLSTDMIARAMANEGLSIPGGNSITAEATRPDRLPPDDTAGAGAPANAAGAKAANAAGAKAPSANGQGPSEGLGRPPAGGPRPTDKLAPPGGKKTGMILGLVGAMVVGAAAVWFFLLRT